MDETDRAAGERARLEHELRTAATVIAGRLQLRRWRARRDGGEVTLTDADLAALDAALARLATATEDVARELGRLGGDR